MTKEAEAKPCLPSVPTGPLSHRQRFEEAGSRAGCKSGVLLAEGCGQQTHKL